MENNKSYIADIYVRLSKEDGDVDTGNKYESNSISNQKELIQQFLISHPEITVHAIREDDGYTGTNFSRPGFQLLLQDIKEKKINCIIVKDLSRVGRNYLKVGEYVQEIFPEQGVRFISVNDGYDSINAAAMDDDIIIPFKNLLNDAYSRDISVKIRSNLDAKRKRGEYTGAFTTFGYMKSKLDKNAIVVDQYAANVVKDIFKWKLAGVNQTYIADRLNAAGIPSPMEYKKMKGINYECSFKTNKKALWCAQTVSRILKNEIYIGNMIQGIRSKLTYRAEHVVVKNKADWIRTDNAHEAIIEKMDFIRVQEMLKRDTRTSPNQKTVYPFGGMLFCGDCKHSMVRKTIPGAKGVKYVYFVCSSNKKTRDICSSHTIKEEVLEVTILEMIQKHIRAVLDVDAILEELAKMDIQKSEIEKLDERIQWNEEEIEKCKRLKISLYEDLRETIIDKEEYLYLKEEYQRRIDEAENAIKHLRVEINQIYNGSGDRKQWVSVFRNHLNVEKMNRKISTQLIDRIFIYDEGRIGIKYKFQDKYDTCLHFIETAYKAMNQEV
ncbi:recombinase family protein [Lachnotalea glycerini]|uniref:recombinase family protein n=1 Tax=Lachnotalea glycerini TaxID=1763509 RepID=UPI0015F26285|nr:recombinase family protein [Lachnotalea glycerini]